MLQSRALDPNTGSYIVQDGRYVMAPAAIAWAMGQILLRRDSVPGYGGGSDVRSIEATGTRTATTLRGMVDEVLRPAVGRRFLDYRCEVFWVGAVPIISVRLYTEDGVFPFQIPWSRPA